MQESHCQSLQVWARILSANLHKQVPFGSQQQHKDSAKRHSPNGELLTPVLPTKRHRKIRHRLSYSGRTAVFSLIQKGNNSCTLPTARHAKGVTKRNNQGRSRELLQPQPRLWYREQTPGLQVLHRELRCSTRFDTEIVHGSLGRVHHKRTHPRFWLSASSTGDKQKLHTKFISCPFAQPCSTC